MNMFALHESVWWMADRDGWFRVSSQELVDQLAVAAERLDQRDLPGRFGSWKGAHNRLRRWGADGTWEKVLTALLA
jgi:transposase